MKHLKIRCLTLILASAVSALPALVYGAASDGPSYPASPSEVVRSLDAQVLSAEQVRDLVDAHKATVKPVSDLEFFAGLRVAASPSSEGIPSVDDLPGIPSDLLESAYSAPELIDLALQERQNLPLGERISYLAEQAERIITISGDRPTEILLRLTLNRSVDVANHVLPIAGRNTDYVARFLANFYRENFELAASFGNNRVGVDSRLTGDRTSTADFLRTVSIAEYGRIYSTLLWRYSQDLTSDSAKAVILMRLLGYLGWDFNADLRRRERPIAETIVDIYTLQHSSLYRKVLDAMVGGKEPSQDDVAGLRRRVFTILQRIPGRLRQAGISPLGSQTY